MISLKIGKNESGQRFDKFLFKLLKNAPSSLVYKQLRKKNITLNGKKDDGKTILKIDDEVRLFLSDETYNKFADINDDEDNKYIQKIKLDFQNAKMSMKQNIEESIIYEDDDFIIANKKAGVLSQKANPGDISINEMIILYLLKKGKLEEKDLLTFRPSVVNRLDRNTSGIIVFGKSLKGLQMGTKLFRDRELEKYYLTIVCGDIDKEIDSKAYLYKDKKTNKVVVFENEADIRKYIKNDIKINNKADDKMETIHTGIKPLAKSGDNKSGDNSYTLVLVRLFSGKTHQIRSHLSYLGHPVIGDSKYGKKDVNDYFKKNYGLSNHLLHSYILKTGEILGRDFKCTPPDIFMNIIKDLFGDFDYGNMGI